MQWLVDVLEGNPTSETAQHLQAAFIAWSRSSDHTHDATGRRRPTWPGAAACPQILLRQCSNSAIGTCCRRLSWWTPITRNAGKGPNDCTQRLSTSWAARGPAGGRWTHRPRMRPAWRCSCGTQPAQALGDCQKR